MIKPSGSRSVVVVGLLVCWSVAVPVRVARSADAAGDKLLQMVPAGSLFCVRVNNLNDTLARVDQFLAGVAPMGLSMPVRSQFAQVLGNPELPGVDMSGSFVVFAVAPAAEQSGPAPSTVFIGILAPVTDYKKFVAENSNVGPPDADGVSENTSEKFRGMLMKQVGDYALVGPAESGTFSAIAKSILAGKTVSLTRVLDDGQIQQAMKQPVWAYANVQVISKVFGPMVSAQLQQAKQAMKAAEAQGVGPMFDPSTMVDAYATIIDTLMKEIRFLSLTFEPKPAACNLGLMVAAVPGTEVANMFTAEASPGEKNELLGYLNNGAIMNAALGVNTPLLKKLYMKSIDLFVGIADANMPAQELSRMKALTADVVDSLGPAMVFSFSTDLQNKPPLALTYVVQVKDAKKFHQVIDDAVDMMNEGAIADFYKSMGVEVSSTMSRSVASYKGVSIDSATFTMKLADANSPQAQMISTLYGQGIDYRWGMVDGMWVCAVSSDPDAAIRKLIDEIKAAGPKSPPSEVQAALSLVPGAATADFVGTYNFLRWFQILGAMMPIPMPQMAVPTQSNIAFAADVGQGKMTAQIALPKEHLMEIMGVFQAMQQQRAPQQLEEQQAQP